MTRTAIYSLQDNALTEQPGMQAPRPPMNGIHDYYWDIYLKKKAAYDKAVAACRTISCHESARSLWKDKQKVEDGKDYEVREVTVPADHWQDVPTKRLRAFPLPVKSEDDLWKEVLTKIHMKALAYVSVGGHPHPGLPNHDPWHREMINKLKSEYIITKR